MGVIIRMDSKKFLKDFIKENDPMEFQYVLISENITTKEKFKNVKAIPLLIPPVSAISELENEGFKSYRKAYLNYLSNPKIEAFISIIVKAVVDNELKIVLLCSQSENEFKYLKIICEYIEEVYKLKTYTYKSYKENPEKACKIKNKDEVKKILNKKLENLYSNKEVDLETKKDKKKLMKELKKLSRKELIKVARKKNIDVDEDADKDKIVKKIAKKLMKIS
ncbi:MAG: hypothetical protein ACK4F9_06915 [Brevinematia bacterium]